MSTRVWVWYCKRQIRRKATPSVPTTLPTVHSWVTEPDLRWLQKCGRCHRRRLLSYYFEMYGYCDGECGKGHDAGTYWWWECLWCYAETISAKAEDTRQMRKSLNRIRVILTEPQNACPCRAYNYKIPAALEQIAISGVTEEKP